MTSPLTLHTSSLSRKGSSENIHDSVHDFIEQLTSPPSNNSNETEVDKQGDIQPRYVNFDQVLGLWRLMMFM